ncbi:MAG: hypothetical protein WKG07_03060 [Hymenobacter sp.]
MQQYKNVILKANPTARFCTSSDVANVSSWEVSSTTSTPTSTATPRRPSC